MIAVTRIIKERAVIGMMNSICFRAVGFGQSFSWNSNSWYTKIYATNLYKDNVYDGIAYEYYSVSWSKAT